MPDERLAALIPPGLWARLTSMPLRLTIDAMRPRSVLHRSLIANPGTSFYVDPPTSSFGGSKCPPGGRWPPLELSPLPTEPSPHPEGRSGGRPVHSRLSPHRQRPARKGFHDDMFRGPVKFSLGFMKPSELIVFGSQALFGAPGAGGSMGFADPAVRLGYGYVTNKMGMDLQGDPRDLALRRALTAVFKRT